MQPEIQKFPQRMKKKALRSPPPPSFPAPSLLYLTLGDVFASKRTPRVDASLICERAPKATLKGKFDGGVRARTRKGTDVAALAPRPPSRRPAGGLL